MIEQWRSFLTSASGEMGTDDNRDCASGEGANLCDLSALGLIAVRGQDAAGFLQNQLTNDVREVTDGRAQLSGYCNPKGRLLTTLLLFHADDTFYMQLHQDMVEPLVERLRKYVLRSKVTLSDAGDELVRFGLWGPDAPSLLVAATGQDCEQPYGFRQSGYLKALRLPGPAPRYEIISELEVARQTWGQWLTAAAQCDPAAWTALDIEAGIPSVLPTTFEEFVPHSLNMDLLGGVSFTKGCFPGQEIVARMHYLGTPKRRMYRARVDCDELPAVATDLYSAGETAAQSAGTVVAAAKGTDGSAELLVVLRTAAQEIGDVRLGSIEGPRLSFLSLPYSLAGKAN
jgi:folate-binding protein YgfZ